MAENEPAVTIVGRNDDGEQVGFAGLNNRLSPTRLRLSDLILAENIDLDDTGRPSRRSGFSVIYAASDTHSIFSAFGVVLFVSGETLYRLVDSSAEPVFVGLMPGAPMAYVPVDGKIYFANGQQSGIYDVSREIVLPWGISPPRWKPRVLTNTVGSFPKGTYQVACTFLSPDGQESGTGEADVVSLPTTGGLSLDELPTTEDANVDRVAIYLTPSNGDTLYRAAVVPVGTSNLTLYYESYANKLRWQFLTKPPAGELLAWYKGRIYMSRGNELYFTRPYAYGHHNPIYDWVSFGSPITMLAPVEHGMYVGTADVVYFLRGDTPRDTTFVTPLKEGVVPGCYTLVDAAKTIFKDEVVGNIVLWVSDSGYHAGLPDGRVHNLTDRRVAMYSAKRGAMLLRENNGTTQAVANTELSNGATTSGMFMSDIVETEIIRREDKQ